MALVCSPELHLNVRNQLEMMKRDNKMGILMMRNKVTRDEWVMEALIVALELYLNTQKPDIKYVKNILSSYLLEISKLHISFSQWCLNSDIDWSICKLHKLYRYKHMGRKEKWSFWINYSQAHLYRDLIQCIMCRPYFKVTLIWKN